MLNAIYRPNAVAFQSAPGCQPAPCVCPACGGLECLCRPRFFAGQLITETDLNLLIHYIREKNKLHNRYLHGWGVVCGLEVVCSPCDGKVTVRQGYAIDPCGEDVIVCQDTPVDVCGLIGKCRGQVPQDCITPSFDAEDPCANLTEEWVLAIRYHENPTRGIASLRASTGSSCCSSCACGGSSSCGCGCHSKSGTNGSSPGWGGTAQNGCGSTNGTMRMTQSKAPPQCEPTAICESYTFEVYKKPTPQLGPTNPDPGDMIRKIYCCFLQLATVLKPVPQQATTDQLLNWCCTLKAGLLTLLATQGLHDCTLYTHVSLYVCPVPDQGETPAAYELRVVQGLAVLFAEFIQCCICSALLPPCPGQVNDPRVPLATITVKRSPCQILRVCDWDPRRFVVTFPTLGYWLWPIGWSAGSQNSPPSESIFARLRELIAAMCCRDFTRQAGFRNNQNALDQLRPGAPFAARREAAAVAPENAGVAAAVEGQAVNHFESFNLFVQAALNPDRQVDATTLFRGAVGATDANGQPAMSDIEMRHPVEFLLANQVAAPLVGDLFTELFTSREFVGNRGAPAPAEQEDLRARLAQMESLIEKQQAQIDTLTKQQKKR